jgi:DNA-binding transcriptional ArsR family regulator
MAKSRQEISKTPYNPKAHAPAVYIPCWLIQVPSSELSHQAKLLYGRLAQWSSAKGDVHRSVKQLSQEIGVPPSTVDRTLKELREVGLIETVRREYGGINHFKFLRHSWMDEKINSNLEYQSSENGSNKDQTPHVKNDVTNTSKVTSPHVKNDVPKIKEIKLNKKKIKRGEKRLSSRSNVSNNFTPTKEHEKICRELNLDIEVEKQEFIDYYKSNGKKMIDWDASFNNWLRKSAKFRKNYNKIHSVTKSINDLKEKSAAFREFLELN